MLAAVPVVEHSANIDRWCMYLFFNERRLRLRRMYVRSYKNREEEKVFWLFGRLEHANEIVYYHQGLHALLCLLGAYGSLLMHVRAT